MSQTIAETTVQPDLKTGSRVRAGSTQRVRRLRERLLDTIPSLCTERGLLITEAYQKYAADPPVLRRARALAHVLDHMTITIDEGEIIVGNQASAPRAAPLFPEYAVGFLADEIDEFPSRRADVFNVSPEVKAAILNIIVPSWRGKTLYERALAIIPDDVRKAQEIGAISGRGNITSGDGHIIMDIPKVLEEGLEVIISKAQAALDSLSPYEASEFKKRAFLQGTVIALGAAIRFADRYADEAERQAADTAINSGRQADLL